MIPGGLAQAEPLLLSALLAMLRPTAAMVAAPMFSTTAIPVPVRVVLALSIGFSGMAVGGQPAVEPSSLAWFALLCAKETAIGLLIGFVLNLSFCVSTMAGEVISQMMGLSFASTVDPVNNSSNNVVSQLISTIVSSMFFIVGAHIFFIGLIIDSYNSVPIDSVDILIRYDELMSTAGLIFSFAAASAASIVLAILLSHVIVAMMSKTAPQINMFSIGFSVFACTGFATLYVAFPQLITTISKYQDDILIRTLTNLFHV